MVEHGKILKNLKEGVERDGNVGVPEEAREAYVAQLKQTAEQLGDDTRFEARRCHSDIEYLLTLLHKGEVGKPLIFGGHNVSALDEYLRAIQAKLAKLNIEFDLGLEEGDEGHGEGAVDVDKLATEFANDPEYRIGIEGLTDPRLKKIVLLIMKLRQYPRDAILEETSEGIELKRIGEAIGSVLDKENMDILLSNSPGGFIPSEEVHSLPEVLFNKADHYRDLLEKKMRRAISARIPDDQPYGRFNIALKYIEGKIKSISSQPTDNRGEGQGQRKVETRKMFGGEYTGTLSATGWPEGEGTLTVDGKIRYKGSFKAGQYDGQGKLFGSDGKYFEGQFKDGEFVNGKAQFDLADGGIYEGEAVGGKREGNGRVSLSNGFYEEGIYKDDKFISGRSRYATGEGDKNVYEGEVEGVDNGGVWNMRPHGVGILYEQDGTTIISEYHFDHGVISGTSNHSVESRKRPAINMDHDELVDKQSPDISIGSAGGVEAQPQLAVIGGELMNPAEIERQSAELKANFESEVQKLLRVHSLNFTLNKEWYVFRNELDEILEKEGLESGEKFAEKTISDLKQMNNEIDRKNALEKARVEPLRLESFKKLTKFGLGLAEMVKQTSKINLLKFLKDKFGDNNVQSGNGGKIYVQGPEHTTWNNNAHKEEKDNTVFVINVLSSGMIMVDTNVFEFDIISETDKPDLDHRLTSLEFENIYSEKPVDVAQEKARSVALKKYLGNSMGDFELEMPQIVYRRSVDDLVKNPLDYSTLRRGLLRYDPEHKSRTVGEVLPQPAGAEAKEEDENQELTGEELKQKCVAFFETIKVSNTRLSIYINKPDILKDVVIKLSDIKERLTKVVNLAQEKGHEHIDFIICFDDATYAINENNISINILEPDLEKKLKVVVEEAKGMKGDIQRWIDAHPEEKSANASVKLAPAIENFNSLEEGHELTGMEVDDEMKKQVGALGNSRISYLSEHLVGNLFSKKKIDSKILHDRLQKLSDLLNEERNKEKNVYLSTVFTRANRHDSINVNIFEDNWEDNFERVCLSFQYSADLDRYLQTIHVDKNRKIHLNYETPFSLDKTKLEERIKRLCLHNSLGLKESESIIICGGDKDSHINEGFGGDKYIYINIEKDNWEDKLREFLSLATNVEKVPEAGVFEDDPIVAGEPDMAKTGQAGSPVVEATRVDVKKPEAMLPKPVHSIDQLPDVGGFDDGWEKLPEGVDTNADTSARMPVTDKPKKVLLVNKQYREGKFDPSGEFIEGNGRENYPGGYYEGGLKKCSTPVMDVNGEAHFVIRQGHGIFWTGSLWREGQWDNDNFVSGNGAYLERDGKVYIGEIEADNEGNLKGHGEGWLRDKGGKVLFKGRFVHGKPEGTIKRLLRVGMEKWTGGKKVLSKEEHREPQTQASTTDSQVEAILPADNTATVIPEPVGKIETAKPIVSFDAQKFVKDYVLGDEHMDLDKMISIAYDRIKEEHKEFDVIKQTYFSALKRARGQDNSERRIADLRKNYREKKQGMILLLTQQNRIALDRFLPVDGSVEHRQKRELVWKNFIYKEVFQKFIVEENEEEIRNEMAGKGELGKIGRLENVLDLTDLNDRMTQGRSGNVDIKKRDENKIKGSREIQINSETSEMLRAIFNRVLGGQNPNGPSEREVASVFESVDDEKSAIKLLKFLESVESDVRVPLLEKIRKIDGVDKSSRIGKVLSAWWK